MYNTCITNARICGSFLYLFQYKNITQTPTAVAGYAVSAFRAKRKMFRLRST